MMEGSRLRLLLGMKLVWRILLNSQFMTKVEDVKNSWLPRSEDLEASVATHGRFND